MTQESSARRRISLSSEIQEFNSNSFSVNLHRLARGANQPYKSKPSPEKDAEIMYDLTGEKDTDSAIQFVEKWTEIKGTKLLEFVRLCRMGEGWADLKEFLVHLEDTPRITAIIRLLWELTNKRDIFQALNIVRRSTEQDNIKCIYKMCQTIATGATVRETADFFRRLVDTSAPETTGFFTSTAHTSGIEGVRIQISKLSGGLGAEEFLKVYNGLQPDWQESTDFLCFVTKRADIGEAVLEFNHITGKSSFADSIILIKNLTAKRELKLALMEIVYTTKKLRLSDIVECLKIITETESLEEVPGVLEEVFQVNGSVVEIMDQVRVLSGEDDVLDFLMKLPGDTGASCLREAWRLWLGLD